MKIKLSKEQRCAIQYLLFGSGYGMTLHAIAGELYDKGGYWEILAPQGEWFGMTILAIALIVSLIWMRTK